MWAKLQEPSKSCRCSENRTSNFVLGGFNSFVLQPHLGKTVNLTSNFVGIGYVATHQLLDEWLVTDVNRRSIANQAEFDLTYFFPASAWVVYDWHGFRKIVIINHACLPSFSTTIDKTITSIGKSLTSSTITKDHLPSLNHSTPLLLRVLYLKSHWIFQHVLTIASHLAAQPRSTTEPWAPSSHCSRVTPQLTTILVTAAAAAGGQAGPSSPQRESFSGSEGGKAY